MARRHLIRAPARPKLTIPSTFPVRPLQHGGQARLFNLYRQLGACCQVEIVSLNDTGESGTFELAPHLTEIQVAKTTEHRAAEAEICRAVGGVSVGDVTMPLLYELTPRFLDVLAASVRTAQLIVAEHPYLLPAVECFRGSQPLVYGAQDVEYILKRQVLGGSDLGLKLTQVTRLLEAEACQKSRLVTACSEPDRQQLSALYDVAPDKIVVVPNGVDLEAVPFVGGSLRRAAKRALGLARVPIALFVGSAHPPNLEAAEVVFRMARRLPEVTFLLVGTQCHALRSRELPRNVGLAGAVDDQNLNKLLIVADVALNPMLGGSGTNLKMPMYMAAGVPVVTTPLGARGLDLRDGAHCLIGEAAEMPAAILRLIEDQAFAERLAREARAWIEEHLDWRRIAARLAQSLHRLLARSARPADELMSSDRPVPHLAHAVGGS